jgi:peptidoglycan L-alanyl-D-glutamate endopeptidase CwlK
MVEKGLLACHEQGLDVLITCTWRSWDEQALEYAKGRTAPGPVVTKAKPGESWHQWGRAIDVVPRRNGKTLVWGSRGNGLDQDPMDDATDDLELWQRIAACFKMAGLEWAGDWASFRELPHLQNTGGLSWRTLMARYPKGLAPGSFV